MFCLCLGLPCVFRQGFRAVLFCQNQSGGFRYGESECGGFHRYRYEGTAFGGGLSAGLVRPLSRRWNLEFELGLGVVWADWERYRCVNCGKRTGKGSGVYVTPTRTAVNLVYLF